MLICNPMSKSIQNILDLSYDIMSLVEDNLTEPYREIEDKHNKCMKHLISQFLYPRPLSKENAMELIGGPYGQLDYQPEHFDIYDKKDVTVFSTPIIKKSYYSNAVEAEIEDFFNDDNAAILYGSRLEFMIHDWPSRCRFGRMEDQTCYNLDLPFMRGELTSSDWEGLMQSYRMTQNNI